MDVLCFSWYDIDNSVFFKVVNKQLIIILVHVDDCMMTVTNIKLIQWVKKSVSKQVEITDMGEIHWLLGIEIRRDHLQGMISLSQHSYIDASLRIFGLEDTKPLSIPMDPSTCLTSDQSPKSTAEIARMAKVPYQEAVSKLMYAALGT
jgi:hypothetical protein